MPTDPIPQTTVSETYRLTVLSRTPGPPRVYEGLTREQFEALVRENGP